MLRLQALPRFTHRHRLPPRLPPPPPSRLQVPGLHAPRLHAFLRRVSPSFNACPLHACACSPSCAAFCTLWAGQSSLPATVLIADSTQYTFGVSSRASREVKHVTGVACGVRRRWQKAGRCCRCQQATAGGRPPDCCAAAEDAADDDDTEELPLLAALQRGRPASTCQRRAKHRAPALQAT